MRVTIVIGWCLVAMVAAAPQDTVLKELEEDLQRAFKLGGELHLDKKNAGFSGLSEGQKQDLVDYHNKARSEVSPRAANMLKMSWSNELATVAQSYAERCVWSHNAARSDAPSFSYVGENLFLTSGTYNGEGVVDSWVSEVKNYNYATLGCTSVCGHYTQVVWHDSEFVGCGAARCNSVSGLSSGWTNSVIVVCNYGKGGNYRGATPYTQGKSCSSCPSGKVCQNRLCANPGDNGNFEPSNDSSGSSTCN
ncbi:peptidase inhibitor 16-like [Mizuhopecten yessoensis]|uniref:Peptidase inhibitor 16 n=1 Tax=Mizuhopecten yessoensis TaxID=6573 RepID=A0A210PN75_MIZYE|nr:peptidase inhibitor 16-like [Mizuhopecten yessoensis]OWF37955.1 Peptidase inhibitor 16 [Mizuhopecten yessoensis]